MELHDKIYNDVIPNHLNSPMKYIPHITLRQAESIDKLCNFDYEFCTIVDKIYVELISENEKSIIIENIKIGGS